MLCRPLTAAGEDWKCSFTIYDKSTEDEYIGLPVNVFRPRAEMPAAAAGDILIVYSAKVQNWRNDISLLTHRNTDVHVYMASKIPAPPGRAEGALQPPTRPNGRLPSAAEHEYAAWLYHSIDKEMVPDSALFQRQAEQSLNIKQKFSVLKDVGDGQFCDIIAQVIKTYDQMDKVTVWVTDYTENQAFFKFSWDGINVSGGQDGDPYGYLTTSNPSGGWPGPYGRRAMQITCFEPHASFLRSEVKAGAWVCLRNLQIKYGRNASNLEGFLREDRSKFNSKIQVDIVETTDPDNVDDRLKAAIRRKREYDKTVKQQKKSYLANAAGTKRKGDDAQPQNSKERRSRKRIAAEKKVAEQDIRAVEVLGLNDQSRFSSSLALLPPRPSPSPPFPPPLIFLFFLTRRRRHHSPRLI